MKRYIVELAIAAFLAGLALLLLIQYYRGAWSDSSRIVEIVDLVVLYALFALGTGYTIWRKYKHWKEGD